MLTGKERLVTILGLGGTGKTRLAVAAAEGLLSAFEGGVWLVPLAGVRDPVALIPTIAAALGVADADVRSPEEAVARRLRAPSDAARARQLRAARGSRARRRASCSSRHRGRACW